MIDAISEAKDIQRRSKDKAEREFEKFQDASDQRARDRYLFFREQQIFDERNADHFAVIRTLAVILAGLVYAVGFVVVGLGRWIKRRHSAGRAF